MAGSDQAELMSLLSWVAEHDRIGVGALSTADKCPSPRRRNIFILCWSRHRKEPGEEQASSHTGARPWWAPAAHRLGVAAHRDTGRVGTQA